MESEGSGPQKGFKVEDRRRFSDSGEARSEAAEESPRSAAEPSPAGASAADSLPEMTFATLILSLSTEGLAHLGEIPDPVEGATRVDLPAARQVIDILGILREKTRGNLAPEESALLEHALYDLRMKYVDRAQRR